MNVLVKAIKDNNPNELQRLLDKGHDKHYREDDAAESSLLHLAARLNHEECAKVLIENGVNVNIGDSGFETPLFHAISFNSKDVVRLLIEKGAKVNESDVVGETPLFIVARRNYLKDLAKLLLENGAEIDVTSELNETPMSVAREFGNEQMMDLFAQYKKTDLEKLIDKGYRYYNRGNYESAILCFDRIIQSTGFRVAEPFIGLGDSKGKIGMYEEAINNFDIAIIIDPHNSTAFNNRGFAFLMLENHQKAIDDFNTAIRLNPNNDSAYANRGRANSEIGLTDVALKDCDTAISINPNEPNHYGNRARILFFEKEYTKAIEDYTKVIELDPFTLENYIDRGIVLGENDNFERALNDFKKAEEIVSQDLDLLYMRGQLKLTLFDKEGAKQDWEKAYLLGNKRAKEMLTKLNLNII